MSGTLTCHVADSLEVVRFTNSNFAECLDSKKLTLSNIFLHAGAAISWKSMK